MRATVLTWTVLRAPPPGHPAGRVVLLLAREDGSRLFALAEQGTPLAIGDVVDVHPGDPPHVASIGRGEG